MLCSSKNAAGVLGAVLGALVLCHAGRAEADLFEFYVDGYGGGLLGTPQIAGVPNPPPATGGNFFNDQSGGLLGGRVGFELLHTDLYLQFDQYFNSMNAAGSSLQLMLGWDHCFGKHRPSGLCGLLGGYGGLVFGFPYTPHPPIDRSQLATFGVAAEAQGGIEYHINRLLVLQAIGTIGYHYLFQTHPGASINISNSGEFSVPTTHGFHLLAKAGLRFHLSVF